MYNSHELAWASGFWDGEGCSGINRHSRSGQPRVALQLAQSGSPDLLYRFQRAVGNLGSVTGPYDKGVSRTTGKPHKLVWMWKTQSFEHAQQVIACLWPWLGEEKKRQMTNSVLTARSWWND